MQAQNQMAITNSTMHSSSGFTKLEVATLSSQIIFGIKDGPKIDIL